MRRPSNGTANGTPPADRCQNGRLKRKNEPSRLFGLSLRFHRAAHQSRSPHCSATLRRLTVWNKRSSRHPSPIRSAVDAFVSLCLRVDPRLRCGLVLGRRCPAEDEVQRGQGDRARRLLPLLVHQPDRHEHPLRRQQQHLGRLRGLRRRHRRQLPQGGRRRHRGRQEDDRQADPLRPRHAPSRRPRLRQRGLRQGGGEHRRPGQLRPPAARQRPEGVRGGRQGTDGPQGRRATACSRCRTSSSTTSWCSTTASSASSSCSSAMPTRPATPSPICPSTRSSAPAMPASTARSTSWAIPTPPRGFASWNALQQLDVKIVCPGHGPLAGKDLLEKQKRYFVELRQQVQKGIDAEQDARRHRQGHRHAVVQGMDRRRRRRRTTSSMSTTS